MNRTLPPFSRPDKSTLSFKRQEDTGPGLRLYIIPLIAVFVILTLFARLFQLTIVKGAYYHHLAETNRIREISVPAMRGTIVDRKGVPIVTSEEKDKVFTRNYRDGEALGHFVGFIQMASKEDIAEDACSQPLGPNDWIGKMGLEKTYECLLRGAKGKKLVEVDAHGKAIRTLSFTPPQTGKTINASLDFDLQLKTHQILSAHTIETVAGPVVLPDKRASVVATNPRTGEVLILYSSPSFDPNAFSLNDQPRIRSYLKDEKKPLFTRPLQGVYPPGSVFKPVLAVGGLQDKIIDTDFTVEDNGFIKAGSLSFGNWYFLEYGKTEGTVNVLKALKRSNDIFFYKLGEKMGDAKIKLWAERFGYGDKTGIAFPDSSGLVPSAFWKKEVIKDRWFLGDTYNESIGQGYLQVTPLQVNQAIATIVNGGKLCKPKLLKGEAPECTKIGISEETDKTVLEGMRQACAPGGTGWPFFNFSVSAKVDKASSVPEGSSSAIISDSADPNGRRPSGQTPPTTPITVGCKTGTAESHAASGLPHAWFTVFAPFDNPEILLTVMVEESGQGSNVAAPIAKEILKTYFERSE